MGGAIWMPDNRDIGSGASGAVRSRAVPLVQADLAVTVTPDPRAALVHGSGSRCIIVKYAVWVRVLAPSKGADTKCQA